MIRFLLATIFAVSTAHACSCALQSFENYFCGSPIVIRASIKPVDPVHPVVPKLGHNGFALDISDVFKNSTGSAVPAIVYAPYEETACGYSFEYGKEYLIFGSPEPPGFYTDLCSNNKKWDSVPADIKTKLDNDEFGKNCTTV